MILNNKSHREEHMGCEFCHTVVLNADDLSTTALEQGGDGVPGRTLVLTNSPWSNISMSYCPDGGPW